MIENGFLHKPEEIAKKYNSNLEKGLNNQQVLNNKDKYGMNKLFSNKKKTWFHIFLDQYKDILMIVLIISSIVSLLVSIFPEDGISWGKELTHIGGWENFLLIIGVTFINAMLGTVQTVKSQKSLDSLKKMTQIKSKVIRNGNAITINTEDIVPGDIILLDAGDLVPADARIINSANLKVNESSLTGESITILKNANELSDPKLPLGDRLNYLYSGCLVTYGRATAIVTTIGSKTEIGKINTLLNETVEKKTPLQVNLDKLAKVLMWAILVICAVLFVLNISKIAFFPDKGVQIFSQTLNFSIALAVAVIPEALSSIVTIVLSVSTKKMSKNNAIVKDLKSIEGLGSVSIICTDKTGTLTQNKMTVTGFYTNNEIINASDIDLKNYNHLKLIECSVLCSDAKVNKKESVGDPTEICLVEYYNNQKLNSDKLSKDKKRIDELPFDSERMMMSTLIKDPKIKHNLMFTKGAIDIMLTKTSKILVNGKVETLSKALKNKIIAANHKFSSEGKRVLCFGYKEISKNNITFHDENDFIFIGLITMIDPPRPEVIQAIKECNISGIKVVMITGDHQVTATAIAKEIGIFNDGDWSLSGVELSSMKEKKLAHDIAKYSVYARVSPEDKIKIVRAWQSKNMIVSMTGDGVNDAPALKQADIGVAMGITGTEVSKDAASIVLTDDNFATIVSAIKFGRSVYNNIKSSIKFLLVGNLATIFVSAILTIISLSYKLILSPFTAIQLLFLNLLTDSWPAISLGLEKYRNDVMLEKPRMANEFFLTKQFCIKILYESLIMMSIVLASFFMVFFMMSHGGVNNVDTETAFEMASSMAFMTLSFCRFFHGFNCKSDQGTLFSKSFYDNYYLFGSILLGIGLTAIIFYVRPITELMFKFSMQFHGFEIFPQSMMWIAFGFGISIIFIIQPIKYIFVRKSKINKEAIINIANS